MTRVGGVRMTPDHGAPHRDGSPRRFGLRLAVMSLSLGAASAYAQPTNSVDELAAQATDPTASLMSFQLNDWYTANFHGLDDSLNQVVFRAAIPFALGGTNHIFRVTQPYVTSSPSGATGSRTRRSSTWSCSARRGAAGVSASRARCRRAQDGLTTDKWTAGPAVGFVNSSSRQYNWGLFAQTFFSFAGRTARPTSA